MLEGRGELAGDPELLGGADELEEMREEVPLGLGLEVEPPTGRELAPLICCCSSAVKVPVILVNWNLAEKAKAGYWGCLGSFRLIDSNRIKLNGMRKKSRVRFWFPS